MSGDARGRQQGQPDRCPHRGGDGQSRTRQGGGAEQRRHLGAEPPARDKDEPFAHLRVLVGELQRDAAAQRVPDDGGRRDAEQHQQVAHPIGEAAQRVVRPWLVAVPVSEQVGRDNRVVLRQQRQDRVPRPVRVAETVDEQQCWSFAGHEERATVSVNDPDLLVGTHQNIFANACVGPVSGRETSAGRALYRPRG